MITFSAIHRTHKGSAVWTLLVTTDEGDASPESSTIKMQDNADRETIVQGALRAASGVSDARLYIEDATDEDLHAAHDLGLAIESDRHQGVATFIRLTEVG